MNVLAKIGFLAVILASAANEAPAQSPWKVGIAAVDITPKENLWMAGYAARTKPAEGRANDLRAKAVAFQDEAGTRFVLVTLDLIGVPRALRENLEKTVREKFQLPPEALMLNASHTHSGPELRVGRGSGDTEREKQAAAYAVKLEEQLVALIGKALADLAPAKMQYFHARCGFAMNRRLPTDKGFSNSPYSEGPVDHDVPVLRIEGADGKPRAILFGYACHNTTLGFYQWCGDYAGFAQEFVERMNPGATALFVMGCGGDQNPYPRGTLELAQQHGLSLATAVGAALLTRPREVRGPLHAAYDLAVLDYAKPFPTRAELVKQKAETKDKYDEARATRLLAHLDSAGSFPENYKAPVQVVRFGKDVLLAALSGETVIDYSLRLKRELTTKDGPAVWVAGYSNDVFTYVPSKRVLAEGGYEAGGAMRFSSYPHPNAFTDTLEERIIGKVHELNTQLIGNAAKKAR